MLDAEETILMHGTDYFGEISVHTITHFRGTEKAIHKHA